MNKNQSKYFNTAVKMDEALLSLLEKKEFAYITVREICDAAGVNRSTFYLHYENTAELLEETTRYILDKHFSYYGIDKYEGVRNIEGCERSELIFLTRKYLLPYLNFVKENRSIFKLVMKNFYVMNMDEVHKRMFKYIFEPILVRFRVPEKERRYVIKYYLNGVFSIIMEWLDNGCRDSEDFIIKIINDCVIGEREIDG